MNAHRIPARRRGRPGHRVPPAGVVLPAVLPAVGAAERRRHRAEVDRDARAERRLSWRELGCLLFVAAFLLLRARYLD